MSASDPYENLKAAEENPDVPEWIDEYLDRVSDRLMFNYDLEKDFRAGGERFDLYGEMEMHHEKHFLHPVLSYGHHDNYEHVFANRAAHLDVAGFERLVDLGHDCVDGADLSDGAPMSAWTALTPGPRLNRRPPTSGPRSV
ncbi:hypothetical protein Halar_3385 [halophilic archaeon DL31]|jgi:hypothetical protein|nr:hypothetical protein Halar_3385 [halophilic archaeon DL31]